MPVKGISNNPSGRPKGIINARVQQWQELSDSITGSQAQKFDEYLNKLWNSSNPQDQYKAAQLYIQVVEYFKPKQSRVAHTGEIGERIIIMAPESL